MLSSPPDFLSELFTTGIPVTPLGWGQSADIQSFVARLDLLHPTLSGNKLFKLWFYLQACREQDYTALVTFGGPYSNHLLATAYACSRLGIPCIGIVRGEKPIFPSETLQDCSRLGMSLRFVTRQMYRDPASAVATLPDPATYFVIPEGGAGETGIRGAALINSKIAAFGGFSHIVCATGTGTTLRGITRSLDAGQQAIGIPVLAIPAAAQPDFRSSLDEATLFFQYAFGGYAKWTPELITFMNHFFDASDVPTDFVYTAKAAFALHDLIRQNYFPPSSRVLLLHTGGLQGNRSLSPDLLKF